MKIFLSLSFALCAMVLIGLIINLVTRPNDYGVDLRPFIAVYGICVVICVWAVVYVRKEFAQWN